METIKDTIELTPNYTKRTFTIRKKDSKNKLVSKFRTSRLPKTEFEEMMNYTQNDLKYYLRTSNDYYRL